MNRATHILRRLIPYVLLGVLIAGVQFLLYARFSAAPTLVRAYRLTYVWDSDWYAAVVRYGYVHTKLPTVFTYLAKNKENAAFFPGFPILIRAVVKLTRLDLILAVPVAAQIACVAFWTYLLYFFDALKIRWTMRLAAIAFVVTHPIGFVMILGYSEPLFLTLLLGFFYWMRFGKGTYSGPIAALHGFWMTLTRIVGAPLCIVPVVHAYLTRTPGKPASMRRALLISIGTAAGTLLFFGYCQWKFGMWNLNLESQRIGWNVHAEYFRFLSPHIYFFKMIVGSKWGVPLEDLNHVSLPITALGIFGIGLWDFFRNPKAEFRKRFSLYLAAFIFLYLTISSHVELRPGVEIFRSDLRYVFPAHVLLLLSVMEQCKTKRFSLAGAAAGIGIIATFFLSTMFPRFSFTLRMLLLLLFLVLLIPTKERKSIWIAMTFTCVCAGMLWLQASVVQQILHVWPP